MNKKKRKISVNMKCRCNIIIPKLMFRYIVKYRTNRLCTPAVPKKWDSLKGCGYGCVNTSYEMCPDNYVGYVSNKKSDLFVLKDLRYANRGKTQSIKKGCEKLVIVMESPHIDEFNLNLIAPALGSTGKRIHIHLQHLLNKNGLLGDKKLHVYLVNAIQYQTSLGFETKAYRNVIFNAVWKKQLSSKKIFQLDFKKRVSKIKPCVVINAMTAINGRKKEIN
ncbi:MAG: hypothetical protein R3Y45_08425 [Bacillota bacterium]